MRLSWLGVYVTSAYVDAFVAINAIAIINFFISISFVGIVCEYRESVARVIPEYLNATIQPKWRVSKFSYTVGVSIVQGFWCWY